MTRCLFFFLFLLFRSFSSFLLFSYLPAPSLISSSFAVVWFFKRYSKSNQRKKQGSRLNVYNGFDRQTSIAYNWPNHRHGYLSCFSFVPFHLANYRTSNGFLMHNNSIFNMRRIEEAFIKNSRIRASTTFRTPTVQLSIKVK